MVSPSPHYKCHLQFHFLFTKYKVGIHAEVNGSHTHTTTRVPKYQTLKIERSVFIKYVRYYSHF